MKFYAIGKKLKLSNNKIIVIKRAGVGYYYRLLYVFIRQQELVKEIENMTNNREDLNIIYKKYNELNNLNKSIMVNIQPFIDVKWKSIKEEDKKLVIESILEFNRYDNDGSGGEITSEIVENEYNFILAFFLERGYKIDEVNNINNYQACCIIYGWNKIRIFQMTDTKYAMNANEEEWKKYVLELQGYNLMTPEEVIKAGY